MTKQFKTVSNLKIEAARFPEISVSNYKTTWFQIPKYLNPHQHRCDNLKTGNLVVIFDRQ